MTAETDTITLTSDGYRQAQAQLGSIRAEITRLEHATEQAHDRNAPCDLNEDCARCDGSGFTIPGDDCPDCDGAGFIWPAFDYEGLTFDQYHDDEDAREAMDPLEVQVRCGWTVELEAEEFTILLCTGGPAVRIMGELAADGCPMRAWIEYQDWGTPWREFHGDHDGPAVLTYCEQFLGY